MIIMTTPSELIGTKPIKRIIMDDVLISHVSLGKIQLRALTPKGYKWIDDNMTDAPPVTVDADSLGEIKELMEADGITIEER